MLPSALCTVAYVRLAPALERNGYPALLALLLGWLLTWGLILGQA